MRQLNHNEYIHELKKFPIYLILDNINDIVNIGSIFRISDALGVSKEALDLCDESIHIDMYGNNSSMNVLVATAIYEYIKNID